MTRASISPLAAEPTRAQVRDYILTMLDGLSGLADSVQDRHTGDRMRDFAARLLTSWAPPAEALGDRLLTRTEPDILAGSIVRDPP